MTEQEPEIIEDSKSLEEAIARMELEIPAEQTALLDAYCKHLWEWNEKINLTRHTTYDLFVRRDLLDTVHLAQQLAQNEDVLDIGTGGGVPGLLLAIIRPDLKVSVCDSVAKKSRVVSDIVQKLDIPVVVHPSKVQDVLEDLRFHSAVARAVGSISKLLGWLEKHWLGFDRLLAIKGPRWVDERGEARHRGLLAYVELRKLTSYTMPGTESESVILELRRKAAT